LLAGVKQANGMRTAADFSDTARHASCGGAAGVSARSSPARFVLAVTKQQAPPTGCTWLASWIETQ
jgi:hypothetical protein